MNELILTTDTVTDAKGNNPQDRRFLPYPRPPAVVVKLPGKWLAGLWQLCWLTGLTLNDAVALLLEAVIDDTPESSTPAGEIAANQQSAIETFVAIRKSLIALHQNRAKSLGSPPAASQILSPPMNPRDLRLPQRIMVPLSADLNQLLYCWGEKAGLTRARVAATILAHMDMDSILEAVARGGATGLNGTEGRMEGLENQSTKEQS